MKKKTAPSIPFGAAQGRRLGASKKPIRKKAVVLTVGSLSKKVSSGMPDKTDLENAVALIRSDISVLREEMNERFEHHQNIILAEYRHRIEELEGKVKKLMESKV